MLTNFLFLAKFLFGFFILFYLVPAMLLRWESTHSWLDKFFKSIVHSHILIILAVHVLVGVKLYEMISLMFLALVVYLIYLQFRRKKISRLNEMNFIISILKFTEKKEDWKEWIQSFFAILGFQMKRIKQGIWYRIRNHPISLTVILLLFLASIYIRFFHSMQHHYYAASDPYVHLKWAKLLKANQIYVDGVYPFGFETIISSLHVLFNLDPYIIIRFIGPLSGFLIVLGIYYIMRENFPKDYMFAIFAVLIYFISSFQFGFLWRQLSSLSMEYGAIFVLPALHFFISYIRLKQRSYLVLSLECFLLTLFIHPYAAICLFISYVFMLFMYFRSFTFSTYIRTIGYFTITGLIGIAPMVIGLIAGIPFHGSSIGFVQESVKSNAFTFKTITLENLINNNSHLIAFIIGFSLVTVFLLFKRKSDANLKEMDFRPYLFISIILVFFYRSEELGIPSIMMAYRLEVFFPILTSVVIGSALIVFNKSPVKWLFQIILIGSFCVYSYQKIDHFQLPKGDRYQYDEAVETYLKIKKDLPLQNWTIISPIEEYSLSIGYGWHYNLSDFVTNLSKGEEMKFPTNDVFIFIENRPINSSGSIETDHVLDLTMPQVGDTLEYYTNPEYRKMLEEKALYWVKRVQNKNPNLLTVYLKTENMTIYRLHQKDANKPIDLSKILK